MKFISSIILSLCSVLGFSQTILYQGETISRTVQDPQTVVLAQGFHAKSDVSNPFIAKIGPNTENQGGGPVDSGAGATNPSGTTAPDGKNFHDTKGNIEVTQAGQLQYTLAIETPPGVQKVAPNISLTYVSGGRNGLAGYGWNISGATSISRVGKNLEKDGVTKGVQLDYTDYYSFNGQRLILKSGEYGKDGAEYVTEKYSNVKIKSVGTVSGQPWQGPEYWEVTSPDGSRAWYGATSSGNSPARTPIDYNIVKSIDVNGNYVTYSYIADGNISLLGSVEWGGNEIKNTPHSNKIEFLFGDRPMAETAYIKGVEFAQPKMLESVVVWIGSTMYKRYNISYQKDLQETAYRYVDKITVVNSNNEEANPVLFTYEQSMNSGWGINGTLKPNSNTDVVGDFDGDGNLDLIRYHPTTGFRVPQMGLYLYTNFYEVDYYVADPIFIGNSLSDLYNAVVVNLKKNGLIRNRQGFVTQKKVTNPSTSKSDLELSFYSLTEDNQLVLDYKKTIPNADYDESVGTFYNGTRTTVLGLKNVDFNGDGLSELVLQLSDRTCTQVPVEPARLPSTCDNSRRYYVIDPDESIQNNGWYYPLYLYEDYEDRDKDLFTLYRAGDFNGDGTFDFLKLSQDKKPLLITFKKNAEGKYDSSIAYFNPTSNETIKGYWEDSLVGDFNGDGLSDIMMPGTSTSAIWYLYTSKGNGFKEETKVFERPEKTRRVFQDGNNIKIHNPRTFVAFDINDDGKTDLILLESGRFYEKSEIQDNNQSVRYKRYKNTWADVWTSVGGGLNPSFPRIGYSTDNNSIIYLNSGNINAELAPNNDDKIGLPVDQWTGAMLGRFMLVSMFPTNYTANEEQDVFYRRYFNIAKNARITSISQGGVITDITYKQLDKKRNPGLYDGAKTESYPYVEISQSKGIYVVSGLTRSTTSDKKLKQDFRYRGLTSNILGKGMVGFRKTARSSWYADGFENTKIWSGVETDLVNDGVPVKEWSIRTNDETKIFPADVSENNTQLLSFKSTTYQIDKLLNSQVIATVPDADKAKVVTAIVPKTSKAKDFLTNATAESTITYGEYYLPVQSISKINSSLAITTTTFEYNNNPSGTGANYYIGRLKSKTEIIQAYNDTKSGKEEYTYENNRIKTIKKWNRDNTGFLLETNSYDVFGNVTEKVVSNSTDTQTQTIKDEYEAKGRFIAHRTDNLGLVTTFTYNDVGQVLTQTDPLQNVITNTYDDWGKLLTSKSNIKGITTYEYIRDNTENITVIQYDPDGNISKKQTNKLGQEYKSSIKTFGQGRYVSKEIQYDILGREIKESEPYFEGQSANLWNVIEYDDTVFPASVTVKSFNGKKVKTSVSGLTTTEQEENGNQRTTSKTTDALENVVSSTDKGGTIQYSYNATGEQIQAKYGGNVVTTKFDAWGRKLEFNDPSNGLYKYEYDGFGQPKKIISPKGTKEYTYNNLGQLIFQKELSTADGDQSTDKTISFAYDNKGRVTSKSGTSKGKSYSSNVSYDQQGRLLSSSESSNGKYFIQKGITYDDKARVTNYEKQLYSSGTLTKVNIENIYSAWNGELYQVKDKNSGKILWEQKETNAKGQVVKAKLGSAEINNLYDVNGFLTSVNHSSTVKQGILQILYSFDVITNELRNRTTGGDFNIVESFNYDDNNRLINWTNPVTGVKVDNATRNVYDAKGRILENDQVGKIKFDNSSKIYQPTGMILNAEGTQNYNNDLVQSIVYNENNDPVFIDGMKGDVSFQYGLSNMRQKVTYGGNFGPDHEGKFTKYYSEDGSYEIVKDNTTGKEKHILYIGGTPYESNIVFLKDFTESSGSYKFLHKDYIGSILAISDEAGSKLEQRHFDAWGNFTHIQVGNGAIITDKNIINNTSLLVDRAYTSHEHFAEVGIIHMNGRLYDSLLRRFLNADENIQDPYNTQNYNKYGYVMNNPLMYNDPSGEFLPWLIGAVVGGYLGGVQANGSWNPGKWNWESSWSAVLGGAIGGAAISGALGNITSNPGAIKSFLPGIVSGGLSSAFNGSNFLGGAIGGISYTGNLFGNKVTSTIVVDAGYRYIVSPDSIYGEEDIIIRNKKGHIMYRILSKKVNKDVTLDTDAEIGNPMTINLNTYEKKGAHAVGFSLDYSATMGGGPNGGLAFVYFMAGDDAGSAYLFGYKGGNVGLEGSLGMSGFYSKYVDWKDKSRFNVDGYSGQSSGYSGGAGIIGTSYSWSNRDNVSELWPGQKSMTTWKSFSTGAAHGVDLGAKVFWANYSILKKLF